MPRIGDVKQRCEIDVLLKTDSRLTSSTYRKNVDVDIMEKHK